MHIENTVKNKRYKRNQENIRDIKLGNEAKHRGSEYNDDT
jgi:hypothetical protein